MSRRDVSPDSTPCWEKNFWAACCAVGAGASCSITMASSLGLMAPTDCFWLLLFHPCGKSIRKAMSGWRNDAF